MSASGRFRLARIVLVVTLSLSSISLGAAWYAAQVALPRYCENPAQTLWRLERVLTQARPAGDGPRTPYVVAAKLLFLLPRQPEETLPAYLHRLERYLREHC